jgi:DNA-binding transcriptional ArsR family regulator
MLESLITSKTRIKLLVKFFLNAQTCSYLRSLESEFGESSNSIRVELNRFEKAGLLVSENESNRKYFRANTEHAFYGEIHNILMKYVGIDTLVDKVIKNIGNLQKAYITGDFAKGIQSKVIDVLLVGTDLDHGYISELIKKAETLVSFRVRYMGIKPDELENFVEEEEPKLLIWSLF